ncbi:hypothetical protein PsalN5692_03756 (plasmid) [Piscirickettsia salmonis]|uniref:hypothetical protein n=1 Tax=Piscirickettsia salmonis TaxID=1238 RepID=UPI0012B9959C|nr:hypothetical protein [Piscirickettsia salmonis]QGP52248.1 hypothetical protein PsalN5692_03756 [Piscirickettsia salmonis]
MDDKELEEFSDQIKNNKYYSKDTAVKYSKYLISQGRLKDCGHIEIPQIQNSYPMFFHIECKRQCMHFNITFPRYGRGILYREVNRCSVDCCDFITPENYKKEQLKKQRVKKIRAGWAWFCNIVGTIWREFKSLPTVAQVGILLVVAGILFTFQEIKDVLAVVIDLPNMSK